MCVTPDAFAAARMSTWAWWSIAQASFGAPVRDAFVRAGVGIVYQLAALAVGVGLMVLVGRAAGRLWRTGPARVRARLAFFFLFFTMVALVNFRGYPTPVQTRLLLPVLHPAVSPACAAAAGSLS